MRQLPPFAEIVAFEAVARHLSFTHAAQELCLTQSAVSHRIRRLERHFGQPLIQRLNPGLALTTAGLALLPDVVAALDKLAQLNARDTRKLRVAAGSALCSWWLAGRLPRFMAEQPGVSVELVPIDSIHSPIPEVDVRILWVPAGDDTAKPHLAPLFVEQVFPVCSPRLLPQGQPLSDARQLARLPLLHKVSNLAGEWSWSVWFQRLGIQASAQAVSELRFTEMSLLMSAAVEGAGVALTRSLLAHDALASGRLVPALAEVVPMASSKWHVARWPSSRVDDPTVNAFVDWLVHEARQSLGAAGACLHAGFSPKRAIV